MAIYVAGFDVGFASFGYGIVQLIPDGEKILDVNVIRTKKDARKGTVLAADDNLRRTRVIYAALRGVVREWNVTVFAAEAMSHPQNASVSAKMSLAWGAVAALSEELRIPMVQATPKGIKKKVCGDAAATKDDIQCELRRRYKGQFFEFQRQVPKTQWEHGFDAVASVVACLDGDVLRMARAAA